MIETRFELRSVSLQQPCSIYDAMLLLNRQVYSISLNLKPLGDLASFFSISFLDRAQPFDVEDSWSIYIEVWNGTMTSKGRTGKKVKVHFLIFSPSMKNSLLIFHWSSYSKNKVITTCISSLLLVRRGSKHFSYSIRFHPHNSSYHYHHTHFMLHPQA